MSISLHMQYDNIIKRFYIIENTAINLIHPFFQEQNKKYDKILIIPSHILQVLYDTMYVESKMPLATYVRYHRDILLQQSDYSQVPDSTIDKASWAVYRQELRDMSAQLEFPDNVTWPVSPDDK